MSHCLNPQKSKHQLCNAYLCFWNLNVSTKKGGSLEVPMSAILMCLKKSSKMILSQLSRKKVTGFQAVSFLMVMLWLVNNLTHPHCAHTHTHNMYVCMIDVCINIHINCWNMFFFLYKNIIFNIMMQGMPQIRASIENAYFWNQNNTNFPLVLIF